MKGRIKVWALMLMAVLTLALLSGCMATETKIVIGNDNKGSIAINGYYSESFITDIGEMTPEEYFQGSIDAGKTLVSVEHNGTVYWGVDAEEVSFSSIEELQKFVEEGDGGISVGTLKMETGKEGGIPYVTFVIDMPTADETAEENGQDAGENSELADQLLAILDVTFPNGLRSVEAPEGVNCTYTEEEVYAGTRVAAYAGPDKKAYTMEISGWLFADADTPISEINFEMDAPKAGQAPEDVKCTAAGCKPAGHIDLRTVATGWEVEVENGSGMEGTHFEGLPKDAKFEAGKTYQAILRASAFDGFYFDDDVTVTLNGKTLGEDEYMFPIGFTIEVAQQYTIKDVTSVKSVAVTVDEPAVGMTPDDITGKVVTDPAGAFGDPQFVWTRSDKADAKKEDREAVFYDDKFEAGCYYFCEAMMEVKKGFEAYNDTPATVNGEKYVSPLGIQIFHDDTYGDEDEPYFFIVEKQFDLTKAEPEKLTTPFIDVPKDAYYYDATVWAFNAEPQITDGNGKDKFMPEQICSRGQVVTFLWRSAGQPAPAKTVNPFEDVKKDDYFYEPVLWAFYNDTQITDGTDPTHFSPGTPCKNSHILTFIYRAMGEPGKTGEGTWYTDAYNWANYKGLLKGTYEGTYDINAQCPRKNVVQYLYQYYVMSGK